MELLRICSPEFKKKMTVPSKYQKSEFAHNRYIEKHRKKKMEKKQTSCFLEVIEATSKMGSSSSPKKSN